MKAQSNRLFEHLFQPKLSKVKDFLEEKAKECEKIIYNYEECHGITVSDEKYIKADTQLEIIAQIMDILDMP